MNLFIYLGIIIISFVLPDLIARKVKEFKNKSDLKKEIQKNGDNSCDVHN